MAVVTELLLSDFRVMLAQRLVTNGKFRYNRVSLFVGATCVSVAPAGSQQPALLSIGAGQSDA